MKRRLTNRLRIGLWIGILQIALLMFVVGFLYQHGSELAARILFYLGVSEVMLAPVWYLIRPTQKTHTHRAAE